jgi:hypothetical protein
MTKYYSLPFAFLLAAAGAGCNPRPVAQNLSAVPRAEIEVTSSPNTSVLIYGSKPAPLALRGGEMKVRADTVRLTTPVQLTAFLDTGDIHIVANGSVPIEVVATLTHAPATRLSARGHYIVLYSGGAGIGPVR